MGRIIAIGDIHGCCKTFRQLLLNKIKLQKSDKIYCIGDYIDRGSDSKGVIDFILELRNSGHHIHTLRGNHEQLMMESVQSREKFDHWRMNGGDKTLSSFGASSYLELKPAYKEFFESTKYFIKTGNHIFVHAGLNFQIPDPFEDEQAMLWIRDFPVDTQKLGKNTIIHGHTPKPLDYILSQKDERVINIDGGCVYKQREGLGNLVALDVTGRKWVTVRNVDV